VKVVGRYSFKNGGAVVESRYRGLLSEIEQAVATVQSAKLRTKVSR